MPEETITLQIQGMTCDGCAQWIQDALKRHRGVKRARIDWRVGTGEVTFDAEHTGEQGILDDPVFQGRYTASLGGGGCPFCGAEFTVSNAGRVAAP